MALGTFKGWVSNKSFGFIAQDGEEPDVFVLKKDVEKPDEWVVGSRIKFSISTTERGLIGANYEHVERPPHAEPQEISTQLDLKNNYPDKRFGKVKFWNDLKGFGFMAPEDGGPDLFIGGNELTSAEIGLLQVGDRLEFSTAKSTRGDMATKLQLVGFVDTGNAFQDSLEIRQRNWKQKLAELAEDENWSLSSPSQSFSMPVLDSYFRHTFLRLMETERLRVSLDGREMAFNTGLVTPNQEAIYALCYSNTSEMARKWRLNSFVKESDRKFVGSFGANLPPLAEYFDDTSDLLFDRRLQLYINIDHILENIDRFPEHLRGNEFVARQLLTSAQVQTEKRVYRNYKTAIPQYFRDRGRGGVVQLLLPICLEHPSKADLALTVAKNDEGNAYLSSTILTLDMAYCNARLLARPDTEWLKP